MVGNDHAVGADFGAEFNIFASHDSLSDHRQAGRRFDPFEILPRGGGIRTSTAAGWTRRIGVLSAGRIIGAAGTLITIANIAFALGRPLRIEGHDNCLVTVGLGAVEPILGHRFVTERIELHPQGPVCGFGEIFKRSVGVGAYRQHGAAGSRRTIGGEFALRMGALMTAAGRDQHRQLDSASQNRRRQVKLTDVAQNPRPKRPRCIGAPVAIHTDLVGSAAGDVIVFFFRQQLFGSSFEFKKIDRLRKGCHKNSEWIGREK
jgi:hypothetical protein